jgi:cell division cycle protein 20 (cofactor of APC complex)
MTAIRRSARLKAKELQRQKEQSTIEEDSDSSRQEQPNRRSKQETPRCTRHLTYRQDRFVPRISPFRFLSQPTFKDPTYSETTAFALNSSSPSRPSSPHSERRLARRSIPRVPEKILDAPGIRDDFYIHVLDWSSAGILAIALEDAVYLWQDGETQCIYELSDVDDYVTAISFSIDGKRLAIGSLHVCIVLYPESDNETGFELPESSGVSTLAWNTNDQLAIGRPNGSLCVYDLRNVHQLDQDFPCSIWNNYHFDRIVGMKWSLADHNVLVTGGNDNLVIIWDITCSEPTHILQDHQAAVRAIAFCPWDPKIFATGIYALHCSYILGGGHEDRKIRFFHSETAQLIRETETSSQVCSLLWSTHYQELLSAQHSIDDQLIFWSYPNMDRIATLKAHTSRPLFLALSPDGQTVATASADENLKFWRCFSVEQLAETPSDIRRLVGTIR